MDEYNSSSSSSSSTNSRIPLIEAQIVDDAAVARALTDTEIGCRYAGNKSIPVVQAQAVEAQLYEDYYRDPSHPSLRYSSYHDPPSHGRVIMYNDDDDLESLMVVCYCFWIWFGIIIIIAVIMYYCS